ncbi:MAG TPA: hypothetical protein VH229_06735 [Candidatus Udaeobacter sp.]|jgi:hypothetical protein|nr:hypothetical protein [Candidatus Udaeobacter sp.]
MDYGTYAYEEPYVRPRRRISYFAWTVAILLLSGFALAAWLGSFYIFDQPERPDSYRILQKLHKIEPTKRFELTAAPAGEFLNPQQLYERYIGMGSAELAKTNGELARNYIRNYQQVRGLVPYVIGRYTIIAVRELGPRDVFTSGMVALTNAIDNGQLVMEHLYPAKPEAIPLMKQTLTIGLEVKLERTHDISSVIHAERLLDGRIMITSVPLLYGSYTVTRGLGTFRLEPPLSLNLAGGWPIFKGHERGDIEERYAEYRQKAAIAQGGPISIPGFGPSATPPPAQNALVRVEQAIPVGPPPAPLIAKNDKLAKPTPVAKGKKGKKQKGESPAPAATPPPAMVAQKPGVPTATPFAIVAARALLPGAPNNPAVSPQPGVTAPVAASSPIAQAPVATATPVPVLPAKPAPPETSNVALASNAGGGSWKTFPAGKMPLGRLIGTGDLRDVADHGLAGERIYLKGQFVVNFADVNKAVMRPRSGLTDKVLHFGGSSSTRIIVEFPSGYTPPSQGSVVSRDEMRPYEITEVRKQEDGQLNVFVREIMQPH